MRKATKIDPRDAQVISHVVIIYELCYDICTKIWCVKPFRMTQSPLVSHSLHICISLKLMEGPFLLHKVCIIMNNTFLLLESSSTSSLSSSFPSFTHLKWLMIVQVHE